jgi:UDP-N-acetylmuramoyl-L-alanyl-D-glutamate--2,6-diaminopimelate ligase
VIAGKGHETTQTFADRVEPFDDREVARSVLASMGFAGGARADA